MRFVFATLLLATGFGCAPKTELDVEFDMVRVPTEYYRGVNVLGVTKPEGLRSETKAILKRLRDCKVAKEVSLLDRYAHTEERDPKRLTSELEKEIEGWNDAKGAQAILVIKMIKDEDKSDVKDIKIVKFSDSSDHDWYPTYGYDYTDRFGFLGSEEFAPKVKADSFGIGLRRNRYEMKIQYLIYHKQLKKIVGMETLSGRATVNVYSETPALNHASVKEALHQSLMERLLTKLCPAPLKKSQRQLVAPEKPKGNDFTVSEGIELAENNQWDKAAEKWRAAYAKDKDNPYIANDLGVHAERSGDLEEAARYYRQAQRGKRPPKFPSGYYDDIVGQFAQDYKFKDSEPRIFAIFSGHSAYVLGGQAKKLQVGAKYPVYRVKHLRYVGKPIDGMEYTEVGVVEVQKIEKGAIPMAKVRIKEFTYPMEMEIGDIILTNPSAKPATKETSPAANPNAGAATPPDATSAK